MIDLGAAFFSHVFMTHHRWTLLAKFRRNMKLKTKNKNMKSFWKVSVVKSERENE
jgi:hypothetical protein